MFESRIINSSPILMILLSLVIASFFDTTAGQIGVCYGMLGETLPSPSDVVALYKQQNIQRMRLYDPDPAALNALRGSNIDLILDVPNPDLGRVASSQTEADKWIQDNIQSYTDGVRFRYINVGNEVIPSAGRVLLQAIQNIERAVSGAGLNIKVSTALSFGTTTDTYPPSLGRFNDELRAFLNRYKRNMKNIPLDFALFTAKSTRFTDEDGKYSYNNLFDASLDSVYAALEKLGGGSMEIVVSESGWPTQGGEGTSVENAKTYVNNLIQHVKKGTPRRPEKAIETYLFAMFDENKKEPDEYEKFWGLFRPDRQAKYEVNFN